MQFCRFISLCLAITLGILTTCVKSDAQQASKDNPSGQGNVYVLSTGTVSVVSAATNTVTAVIAIDRHKEGTSTYTHTDGGGYRPYRPMFLNPDQTELFVPTFVQSEPAPEVDCLSVVATADNSVTSSIRDYYRPQTFSADWNDAYYTGGGGGFFYIAKTPLNEIVNATADPIAQPSEPNGLAYFGLGMYGVQAYVISANGSKLYVVDTDHGYIWVIPTANANLPSPATPNPNAPSPPQRAALLQLPNNPRNPNLNLPPALQDAYNIISRTPTTILLAPRSWEYIQLPPSIRTGSSLALSPDNSKLYMTGPDGLSVISTETKSLITTIPNSSQYYGVKVSADGSKLYVLSRGEQPDDKGLLTVISSENTIIARIPVGDNPTSIVVSDKTSDVFFSRVLTPDFATKSELPRFP